MCSFADLPIEMLFMIARDSYAAVRAMLAVPAFARALTLSDTYDYRIAFGETVEINVKDAWQYDVICILWSLNGRYHRVDGPALERASGAREWWQFGNLHRRNGPARELKNGTREWWLNGERHRVDGPAIEHNDGACEWWYYGALHRSDGPAIMHSDGTHIYYINGHRQ